MATSSRCSSEGYVFMPSDEKLVQFLYNIVHYCQDHPRVLKCDLYGPEEPWEVWGKFGGDRLDFPRERDLYFFTKLKKMALKGGGPHHSRRVGDGGTWSAARAFPVSTDKVVSHDGVPINLQASKKHLCYENEGSPHHAAWLLAEFSLGRQDTLLNRFYPLDDKFVLCRLRKKYKRPPKAPQVSPPEAEAAAAAEYYHHHRPMPKHVAADSKKRRRLSSGTTHGSNHDQVNDVGPVPKKPRKRPDLGGQESTACDLGSTILVGEDIDQECCYPAALTSACTSNASVPLRPPNSSLTERTPMSSSSYDDAFSYDLSFYFSDQGYQHSDSTGSFAMTTTNITSTESSDPVPLSCSYDPWDNLLEDDGFLAPTNQEFTDQQAPAEYATPNNAILEQPPNNCTGSSVTTANWNNSSAEETPMSSFPDLSFSSDWINDYNIC